MDPNQSNPSDPIEPSDSSTPPTNDISSEGLTEVPKAESVPTLEDVEPSPPTPPAQPAGLVGSPAPPLTSQPTRPQPYPTQGRPPQFASNVPPSGTIPPQGGPPRGMPPHGVAPRGVPHQPPPQPGSPYGATPYGGSPYGGPPRPQGPPPSSAPRRKRNHVRTICLVLAGIVLLLLCSGSLFSPKMGGSSPLVEESYYPYDGWGGDKVAIITISGLITQDIDGYVDLQIREAIEDDSIKAVVLRVDSPGGTVTGSDYYLYRLRQMKSERDIPVIVSMGSMAASGGYYVSMCGDKIYAEQSTFTGSIGVKIPLFNAAELCEKVGIEDTTIASHRLKGMGGMATPMTDEERDIWQGLVDDAFGTFKEKIREGRPYFEENPEELDALATGQVYTANQALENGLVDEIGFLDQAVDYAIKQANLDPNKVRVVRYGKTPSLTDLLLGQADDDTPDPLSLLDMATPTAYYICPRGFPMQ
jgi:protease IV